MAITISGSGITSANIADGTIVNADVADVAASKLTGALPAIDGSALTNLPGGGKVLQVVQGSLNTTEVLTTSNTRQTTTATVSITPSATTSKILVMGNGQWYKYNNGTHGNYNRGAVQLYKGTTSTLVGGEVFVGLHNYDQQSSLGAGLGKAWGQISLTYLDSPSTTSSTTYGIAMKVHDSENGQIGVDNNSLIAIEIGA